MKPLTSKVKMNKILIGLLAGIDYADTYGRDGAEDELTEQANRAIADLKAAVAVLREHMN